MRRNRASAFILCVVFCCLIGCGGGTGTNGDGGNGGGSGGGNPPPPQADFSVVLESPQVTLQQQGASQFQTVQLDPINGFVGTVSLTFSGLPSGISVSPSGPYSSTITDGAPQQLVIQMAASVTASVATTTITVTATSGTLSHSEPFSLAVTPVAPFSIQLSPSNLSVGPASSTAVQISVTSNGSATLQIGASISGTPSDSGVAFFPPQGFITPTNPGKFLIEASALAQPVSNFPITVTGSDNAGNTNVTTLMLTIVIPYSPSTAATRTTFATTNGNPTGAVYDAARKLVFTTVQGANEVIVTSSVDAHQVAKIPVLAPRGIDETPDGSEVVVGAVSPFISVIDPDSLQVVRRISAPEIPGSPGVNPFLPEQIVTLSNGSIFCICFVPDSTATYLYSVDLATGQATLQDPPGISYSTWVTRSPDHTEAVIAGLPSNGTGVGAALYSALTDSFINAAAAGPYVAIRPDNLQFVAPAIQSQQTIFYDGSFNEVGAISLNDVTVSGAIYSTDGKHAYIFGVPSGDGAGLPTVTVVNTATFAIEGVVQDFEFGQLNASTPYAIDETGMIFAGSVYGLAYVDASSPGLFGLPVPGTFSFSPTLLSASAATSTQLSGAYLMPNAGYKLFFGAPPASPQTKQATSISYVSSNFLNVTAPAVASPGPVNVTLTRADGWSEMMPNTVSYGPEILFVGAGATSSSGGAAATVWGYGFDSADTQVLIGGAPAQISQISVPQSGETSPFALSRIQIVTPPGTPGPADVTVNTSRGSTTAPGGFQFLATSQVYPVTGALEQIVYDQARQRLYAANATNNEVEVFDLASDTFLTPIAVGKQPVGVALTPDGTLLATANFGDGTVSVINLASMQVTATYSALAASDMTAGCGGVVVSVTSVQPHRMLVDVSCTATLDGGTVHLINLDTGSLSCSGTPACGVDGVSVTVAPLQPMASSGDGSQVFVAGGYGSWILNYSSNAVALGPELDPFNFWQMGDAAADADGTLFAQGYAVYDQQNVMRSDATGGSVYVGSYFGASLDPLDYLFGEKLNASGSLLYVPAQTASPSPGFVDIFDTHTGQLAWQVAMPEHLPGAFNTMTIDETGTKMFVISNSGITIAQLPQLPLGLATVRPATGSAGTEVTLRGSGFQTGATVTFGTTTVSATFVDAQTLRATVPSLPAGPLRIVVTNPDGTAYNFDDAFVAN